MENIVERSDPMLLFSLIVLFYLIPSIVAIRRRYRNWIVILVVQLLCPFLAFFLMLFLTGCYSTLSQELAVLVPGITIPWAICLGCSFSSNVAAQNKRC